MPCPPTTNCTSRSLALGRNLSPLLLVLSGHIGMYLSRLSGHMQMGKSLHCSSDDSRDWGNPGFGWLARGLVMVPSLSTQVEGSISSLCLFAVASNSSAAVTPH